MACLTGEQIREAARTAKIDRAPMNVPELGGEIWVRGQSGKERDQFEESRRFKKGPKAGQSDLRNFRAVLATKVIVNEAGERLLNDNDADVLGRLGVVVLDRILAKSNELSGIAEEAVEDLGNDSGQEGSGASSST